MTKRSSIRIVKSRATFDACLDHLATEVRRAGDNWRLWGELDTAFEEYSNEVNQTPQFWRLIIRALQDSVILRLVRLFDPTNGALSLGNFVDTIHQNLVKLSLNLGGFDPLKLAEEQRELSDADPLVKQLLQVRNDYLVHREARLVSRGTFVWMPQLSQQDIQVLLTRASAVVDKYCILYGRPLLSARIIGADDYKRLLELLRKGLEAVQVKRRADDNDIR